jgi:hypothetical protein
MQALARFWNAKKSSTIEVGTEQRSCLRNADEVSSKPIVLGGQSTRERREELEGAVLTKNSLPDIPIFEAARSVARTDTNLHELLYFEEFVQAQLDNANLASVAGTLGTSGFGLMVVDGSGCCMDRPAFRRHLGCHNSWQ